jgi:Arc/MetJ-type ribon-helix-helix transcriptional regulator
MVAECVEALGEYSQKSDVRRCSVRIFLIAAVSIAAWTRRQQIEMRLAANAEATERPPRAASLISGFRCVDDLLHAR